ncbi:hypothetical protein HNQ51_002735 [Inhella inkyongensis]|uniref:Uncharacterized protein n=1 Tax=Inhella inkyongensis TaxID=392593 RepID=A0A840S8T9_9BURK|nr:hypothetical protein [Inhella inkyongensis]MBB5205416.1 hypothetical protein [Inhella inkyongensis]
MFDRAGDYDVVASKAGHASASLRVRVTQGRCHVQTESWRPALAVL